MVDDLLEPLKVYNETLKKKIADECNRYFDELVEKSNIDLKKNEEIDRTCNEKKSELSIINKHLDKIKTYKLIYIALGILSIIIAIACLVISMNLAIKISLVILFMFIGILLLVFQGRKVQSRLIRLENSKDLCEAEIRSIKEEGLEQLKTLNNSYDWNIPAKIFNNCNSLIRLDENFNLRKYMMLHDRYGFMEDPSTSVTILSLQSGDILGNPFLMCTNLYQDWKPKTYKGSKRITYTVRVENSDGKGYHTEMRTQVLYATVEKEVPTYEKITYLVYGNDAAPKLCFSRSPSKLAGKDKKDREREIKKIGKKLDKKVERELMDDDASTNYTRLANEEFEALFGGTNRNNEMEFRLLFTPLGQRNLVNLLINAKPFGDDFYMTKEYKLNYIQSEHSQAFEYIADPNYFKDYSIKKAKRKFIDYNLKYLESLFFDLAPIISIPLYQQTKTQEFIYKDECRNRLTNSEYEVMANILGEEQFNHPNTNTKTVLKCEFVQRLGNFDVVKVTAYSYTAIPKKQSVSVLGADGFHHSVVVDYFEYEPVQNSKFMVIENKKATKGEFDMVCDNVGFQKIIGRFSNKYYYQRGIFAAVLNDEVNEKDLNLIDILFDDDK